MCTGERVQFLDGVYRYSVSILSDPPIMVCLGMSMSMALFSGVSRLGAGVGPLACRLFLINKYILKIQ